MLEGMFGAALIFAAFAVGFKLGQTNRPTEQKPKTAEEERRERNFKRFMSYNGGSSAGQNDI